MTEREWLTSEDPAAMLRNYTAPSNRLDAKKLRLWVEACRAYWQRDDRAFGNYDLDSPHGLAVACENWSRCHPTVMPIDPLPMRAHLLRDIIGNPFRPVALPKRCEQCGSPNEGMFDDGITCRCTGVVGCPWLTPTVLSLAQAAYETRPIDDTLDPVRLMILADALEEAGCEGETRACPACGGHGTVMQAAPDRGQAPACDFCEGSGNKHYPHELLTHLRSHGPHVRGCWVLDLILGKK